MFLHWLGINEILKSIKKLMIFIYMIKKRNFTNIVNANVSIEPSLATQNNSKTNKKG